MLLYIVLAYIIEEYKRNNNVNCITWPAQSPDLNIIENIWRRIKRELQNTAQNINTPDELFHAIHDLWISYQQQYIQNLYNSIPRRMIQRLLDKVLK